MDGVVDGNRHSTQILQWQVLSENFNPMRRQTTMNHNRSHWSSTIPAIVALMLFGLCSHQTLAQQIEFKVMEKSIGKNFVWKEDTNSFNMYDGNSYSFDDITKMLQVEKGGKAYFQENPYPWVKLGNMAWVFGPDGELRYCPTCAGTGDPGDIPPWGDPKPKAPWPVAGPFVVQTGPVEDGAYVARHDNTMTWNCRRLYYDSAEKSNWMECRK